MADADGHPVARIRWAHAGRGPCPVRARRVGHAWPRALMVRARPRFEALLAARQRRATAAGQGRYAKRAGVEGTISRGVRVGRPRRSRRAG